MANLREKEREARQYHLDKWTEQTDVGKHVFIWKFFLGGNEIIGWNLVKATPYDYKDRSGFTYIWRKVKSDVEELIKIDIVESASWRKSHETLLDQLIELQAPQLPKAESRKIVIGDVAFIGFGETIQSIIFTRANMLVRIHSVGKKDISIVDIAKQLDDLFLSKPQLTEKGVIPEISSFSSAKKIVQKNETVVLDIVARDPLNRPLWFKLMVDQGELFVRDEKIYFSSNTSGDFKISLFTINENGFAGGRDLKLEVG